MAIIDTISGFGESALNFGVMFISIAVSVAFVVGIIFLIKKLQKYSQFRCTIWSRDGFGQIKEEHDSAGIFEEKSTRNKRFFLRKNKVGLNPDEVPYIQSGNRKTVYLYKTGLKNFHFIKPKIKENPNPSINLQVGEEDVNWALNAYERAKKTFTSSTLIQYMPWIALGFVTIAILIIFIYFFKDFSSLREMAEALKDAATAIKEAEAGTTVLPEGGG